ncbi:hypothetical protein SI65_00046 [Aspergillus cristatus]|uniref:Transcription factor IIIC putative zinc-finger domain-containing protein n=1 Tax=Aspergillus cristatus TaxID=573508 RepID=A0A1E3BNH2_ASPCR|nr:hypothetical protein SI65_00046 [Aspergillus cristatus]
MSLGMLWKHLHGFFGELFHDGPCRTVWSFEGNILIDPLLAKKRLFCSFFHSEIAQRISFYVLTPRSTAERTTNDTGTAGGQWHFSRFRTNLFTASEWPVIYPQDRQTFSIGAEQSNSTIVGLKWSPPGLARHRRCVLSVLTSNLMLSFYEPAGLGKWTRIAIVNNALKSYFEPLVEEEGPRLRKSTIRSFSWCPPIKAPRSDEASTPYSVPDAETRWGVQLLAVTNDDNEVIFLRTQRSKLEANSTSSYGFNLLSVTALGDLAGNYPMIHPGSVFSTALKSRIKASQLSCGPWLSQTSETQQDIYSVTSNVAILYGTKVRVIKLDVALTHQNDTTESDSPHKTIANSTELDAPSGISEDRHFTGPFQWLYTGGSQEVLLTAGVFGGLVVMSVPAFRYLTGEIENTEIQTQEWPFHENTVSGLQTDESRHWEPISGMSSTSNERDQQSTLYLSTLGGYGAAQAFNGVSDQIPFSLPPWKAAIDDYTDQFDIDRDLGGMVTGRIWGLACHNGHLAVAFTVHPKDMIEYRTAAEERTTIVFIPLDKQSEEESATAMSKPPADQTAELQRAKREAVLGYILHAEQRPDGYSELSKKVTYAAARCAILDCENEALLARARESLDWLMAITGLDFREEMSRLSIVEPKSPEKLEPPGKEIFEQCDICDAGIACNSIHESQCANGHVFARCNLTFLSIQEPGVSKFCSDCGTEYLDGDLLGSHYDEGVRTTCQTLCDAFDVCIYCGGKFRP